MLSYEVRAMKPERAIYEAAVAKAGCAASEVFFTDDKAENVEGASTAGLDAVVFTSPEQLQRDLVSRRLPV